MNDRSKILMAVFFILLGAFSLKWDLTGNVVREDSSISVNTDRLKNNDVISITIKPGIKGVESSLQFFREDGLRIAHLSSNVCKYSRCFEEVTINKRISVNSEGDYRMYGQINDIGSNRPIKVYFTVESDE